MFNISATRYHGGRQSRHGQGGHPVEADPGIAPAQHGAHQHVGGAGSSPQRRRPDGSGHQQHPQALGSARGSGQRSHHQSSATGQRVENQRYRNCSPSHGRRPRSQTGVCVCVLIYNRLSDPADRFIYSRTCAPLQIRNPSVRNASTRSQFLLPIRFSFSLCFCLRIIQEFVWIQREPSLEILH